MINIISAHIWRHEHIWCFFSSFGHGFALIQYKSCIVLVIVYPSCQKYVTQKIEKVTIWRIFIFTLYMWRMLHTNDMCPYIGAWLVWNVNMTWTWMTWAQKPHRRCKNVLVQLTMLEWEHLNTYERCLDCVKNQHLMRFSKDERMYELGKDTNFHAACVHCVNTCIKIPTSMRERFGVYSNIGYPKECKREVWAKWAVYDALWYTMCVILCLVWRVLHLVSCVLLHLSCVSLLPCFALCLSMLP